MSGDWDRLYADHAFKPHPSLWELASAHVPFEEMEIAEPPEPRVLNGIEERDGLVALIGASGLGKSSVLAHTSRQLNSPAQDAKRTYLPLFVPVAARADPTMGVDRFGQEVIREFLAALATQLQDDARKRLEQALADSIERQHTPATFNAKLMGGIGVLQGEGGLTLATESETLIGTDRLDAHGGLRTLNDVARNHGYEIVVFIEDTDQWSQQKDGAETAEAFFTTVLRPLVADADVAVVVAVQDRWESEDYCQGVLERAVASIAMPPVPQGEAAVRALRQILTRRLEHSGADAVADVDSLFSEAAIALLAEELTRESSFRAPLTLLRDTLDKYSDQLPEQLTDEHLVEGAA